MACASREKLLRPVYAHTRTYSTADGTKRTHSPFPTAPAGPQLSVNKDKTRQARQDAPSNGRLSGTRTVLMVLWALLTILSAVAASTGV